MVILAFVSTGCDRGELLDHVVDCRDLDHRRGDRYPQDREEHGHKQPPSRAGEGRARRHGLETRCGGRAHAQL